MSIGGHQWHYYDYWKQHRVDCRPKWTSNSTSAKQKRASVDGMGQPRVFWSKQRKQFADWILHNPFSALHFTLVPVHCLFNQCNFRLDNLRACARAQRQKRGTAPKETFVSKHDSKQEILLWSLPVTNRCERLLKKYLAKLDFMIHKERGLTIRTTITRLRYLLPTLQTRTLQLHSNLLSSKSFILVFSLPTSLAQPMECGGINTLHPLPRLQSRRCLLLGSPSPAQLGPLVLR